MDEVSQERVDDAWDEVSQERVDDAWDEGFAHGYSRGKAENARLREENYDLTLTFLLSKEKQDAEIERLREALVEAEAELIYLRRHGKDGARWEANDSKDVWRGFAREALKEKE